MPICREILRKSHFFVILKKKSKKKKPDKFQDFRIFKVGPKRRQICQFMEKYEKIGIFFILRKKKFPEEN